jgi:hypothetical protein
MKLKRVRVREKERKRKRKRKRKREKDTLVAMRFGVLLHFTDVISQMFCFVIFNVLGVSYNLSKSTMKSPFFLHDERNS